MLNEMNKRTKVGWVPGEGVGVGGRLGAQPMGGSCGWQAGELPSYRSRLGAQTMARLRACMLVLALCLAMRAKCLSRYSRVLGIGVEGDT